MKQTRCLRLAIVPLVAALLLAGCTPQNSAQVEATKLVNNLNQITDQDLANAITLAKGMTPPDTQAVTCFQFIQTQLPTLRSEASLLAAHAGAFTTFEAGHILVGVA
jgi:hypothetical protein